MDLDRYEAWKGCLLLAKLSFRPPPTPPPETATEPRPAEVARLMEALRKETRMINEGIIMSQITIRVSH